jgi:hypothetical protein
MSSSHSSESRSGGRGSPLFGPLPEGPFGGSFAEGSAFALIANPIGQRAPEPNDVGHFQRQASAILNPRQIHE